MAVKYDCAGVNQDGGINRGRTAPFKYCRHRVAGQDFHDPIPWDDGIGGSIPGRRGGERLEYPSIGSCLGGGKGFDVTGARCAHCNLDSVWRHWIYIAGRGVRLNVEGLSCGPNRRWSAESSVREEPDGWSWPARGCDNRVR